MISAKVHLPGEKKKKPASRTHQNTMANWEMEWLSYSLQLEGLLRYWRRATGERSCRDYGNTDEDCIPQNELLFQPHTLDIYE